MLPILDKFKDIADDTIKRGRKRKKNILMVSNTEELVDIETDAEIYYILKKNKKLKDENFHFEKEHKSMIASAMEQIASGRVNLSKKTKESDDKDLLITNSYS